MSDEKTRINEVYNNFLTKLKGIEKERDDEVFEMLKGEDQTKTQNIKNNINGVK